jgi:hypothetical protein
MDRSTTNRSEPESELEPDSDRAVVEESEWQCFKVIEAIEQTVNGTE